MSGPSFAERCAERIQVGVIGTTADPIVVEILAALGFDYYVLDLEHGTANDESCATLVRACRLADIAPFVRVPPSESPRITRLLDAGATGLLVPGIEGPADLVELGLALRFPPDGRRGMSATFVSKHGLLATDEQFLLDNSATFIVIQIENRSALEDLDAILDSGLGDAIMLGERDFSISLGIPGQTSHPLIASARDRIDTAGRSHDVLIGALARKPSDVARLMTNRVATVLVSLTSLMQYGGEDFIGSVRSQSGDRLAAVPAQSSQT